MKPPNGESEAAEGGGRSLWLAAAGLAWLAAAVTLYFVSHKPFSPLTALRLVQAAWQLGVALGLLSLAGGLGGRLLPAHEFRPLARLALQAALGLGLLSLAALLLGALGGLHPLVLGGGLALGLLLLARPVLAWWRLWRDLGTLWAESGPLDRWLGGGVGLILAFTLAAALAPALKFDAQVYHLTLPRAYLEAGRLVYTPGNMYWGMPHLGEMLYTWAIGLGGNQAAVVVGWLAGLLALAGLVGHIAQRLGPRAAWVGAAALLSGFTLADSLGWGYVDWFAILFGWCLLAAFDRWRAGGGEGWLIWAGVFAGLALGVKYTTGVLLIAGAVSIALHSLLDGQAGRAVPRLLRFGLAAAALMLPWLLKNAIVTGNPAYPFLFPAGAMDRMRLDMYQGGSPWGGWQDVVFLPLRATFIGSETAPGYSASIGPLLLGLGALAWIGWRGRTPGQRETIRNAALLVLPGLLVWMVAGRFSQFLLQSRLYFALFPAIALLAGAGFSGLESRRLPGLRPGRVAAALVCLALGFNLFELGVSTVRLDPAGNLLGLTGGVEYLDRNLGWFSPAMRALRELPEGSQALLLFEPRSLYCAPACEPDEVLDRWPHDLAQHGSPEAVLRAWQAGGATHLLYFRLGDDFLRREDARYSPESWQALDALLAGLPEPEGFGDAYLLYTLSH